MAHQMAVTVSLQRAEKESNILYVIFPGILAHAKKQAGVITDAIRATTGGHVVYVDYGGSLFTAESAASSIADSLARLKKSLFKDEHKVIFIGISLGGLVAHKAARILRDVSEIVYVDTPFGAETLLQMPGPAAGFIKLCKRAPLPNFIGNRILNKLTQGPKDENIIVPKGSRNPRLYKEDVKLQALEGLTGHDFDTYWAHLRSMILETPDTVLKKGAIKRTYIVCTKGNDVVTQPLAREQWEGLIGDSLNVIEVNGVHCGFLEQYVLWEDVFKNIFAEVPAGK